MGRLYTRLDEDRYDLHELIMENMEVAENRGKSRETREGCGPVLGSRIRTSLGKSCLFQVFEGVCLHFDMYSCQFPAGFESFHCHNASDILDFTGVVAKRTCHIPVAGPILAEICSEHMACSILSLGPLPVQDLTSDRGFFAFQDIQLDLVRSREDKEEL